MDKYTFSFKSFAMISLLASSLYLFSGDSYWHLFTHSKAALCTDCPVSLEQHTEPGPLAAPEIMHHPLLNVQLRSLSIEEADEIGLIGGAKLVSIQEGPIQESFLIRDGFVITRVNEKPVYSAKDLFRLIQKDQESLVLEGIYDDLAASYDDLPGNYRYEIYLGKSNANLLPQ